jgi:hypothetical protein
MKCIDLLATVAVWESALSPSRGWLVTLGDEPRVQEPALKIFPRITLEPKK